MIRVEFDGERGTNKCEMKGTALTLAAEMMSVFLMMHTGLSKNSDITKELEPMLVEQALEIISGETKTRMEAEENQK